MTSMLLMVRSGAAAPPPIPSPAGRGGLGWGLPRFKPQLTLQESDGRFFSAAYFLAAASIIGRTTFWSESIQSETKFQPLPSHWKTRAVAIPVWLRSEEHT